LKAKNLKQRERGWFGLAVRRPTVNQTVGIQILLEPTCYSSCDLILTCFNSNNLNSSQSRREIFIESWNKTKKKIYAEAKKLLGVLGLP